MTFDELNLNNPLRNALADLGITSPTPIQERVFSVVMAGKNVCGIAQTGTGKTFAYLLPLLRQFVFTNDKFPQTIILVPTRELAVQVVDEIKKLSAYMTIRVVGIYGGVNFKPQAAEVAKGVDFLVATPGRIIDLLSNKYIVSKGVKKLVIDEFDEMLNLGFRAQIKQILDLLPEKRQNLMFSATISDEVEAMMEEYFPNIDRVEATPMGTPLANIEQSRYDVLNFYTKINLLKLLLNQNPDMNKVLVFVSTKHLASLIADEIESEIEGGTSVIHSNKSQLFRFEAVKQFHEGGIRVLVATDVIARGIDVSNVSHVINFDLPEVPQTYIHRIGRTGRADKNGISIAFVAASEKEQLVQIEELMNKKIKLTKKPAGLVNSDRQIPAEESKDHLKFIKLKTTKRENVGPAFHEKLEKNKKVNVRRDHEAEKKRKYGKSYELKKRNS